MAQDLRREWLENAVARWEKPILHLCYAYLGDTALAEDAVQETFSRPGNTMTDSAAKQRKKHG